MGVKRKCFIYNELTVTKDFKVLLFLSPVLNYGKDEHVYR